MQRQYTGTAGRIENAQVAVCLTYAAPGGHAFIDRALHLPKSWCEDPDRRARAGVPDDVQFATKGQLAGAMIDRAADRVFHCENCGHTIDRDLNAAINLATWGAKHHLSQVLDPEARGQVNNAHRPDGSGSRTSVSETSRDDVGTLTAPAA